MSLPENAQRELRPGETYQPLLSPEKRHASYQRRFTFPAITIACGFFSKSS